MTLRVGNAAVFECVVGRDVVEDMAFMRYIAADDSTRDPLCPFELVESRREPGGGDSGGDGAA